MPKNVEELYEQKQFEIRAREEREMRIAELEEQLNLTRNVNDHLNNELDKRIRKLDQVNGCIQEVKTGKVSNEMFKSNVISIMGWRR